MFQDVEYRRVDDISLADEPDPRARWFWILTLLVFFINTVAILSELGYFIDEALHQNIQSYYFLPLILSLFGQATLANGLFGRVHRGVSLHMYVIFFEYIPGFLFSTALLIFVCGYRTMRDAIQKIVEEHHWQVHATTLMIWLLLLTAFLAVYHLLAGWIVYRYRKIRRQRDWNF